MTNNGTPQPNRPKKVFDVMRPGKAPASPTSRPVIVGHKPQAPDDQFVPRPDTRLAADPSEKRPLLGHKQSGLRPDENVATDVATPKNTTEPVGPTADDTSLESVVGGAKPGVPAEKEANDMPAQDTQLSQESEQVAPLIDEEPEQPGEFDEEASQPTAAALEKTGQAEPDQQADVKPATEDDSQDVSSANDENAFAKPMTQDDVLAETDAPALEHAIVSHHHKHRTKLWEWVLIFLLMVVVAAVALNFLLDAEVITTGVDIPHTDLLK